MATIQAYFVSIDVTSDYSSDLKRLTSDDILLQFAILDQYVELDTVRKYYFSVLKLARYVRFVFDKASWPQEVQCVRLELIGCPAGEKIHILLYTSHFHRQRNDSSR